MKVWNRKTEKVPSGAVWVGRPTKWGNPYSEISGTVPPEFLVESHGEAVARYRDHLESRPDLVEAAKRELRGRDLVCVCFPKPCHAMILFEVANAPE